MASQPPELPESIILGSFSGIRNTVSRERLQQGELMSAVNVDIDDAGQLRRRRGRRRVATGSWHSICTIGGGTLGVKDGQLGFMNASGQHNALGYVGDDPLCYTQVGNTVYFSSRSVSGKVERMAILPWGEQGAGEWVSPVVRPTATLGAVAGKQLTAPPNASEIEAWKGRIYLAVDNVIWATELYLYDKVDASKNYIMLEDDVTMIRGVEDGLYVGTTRQLLFLQGTLSEGLKQSIVMESPVVAGSSVLVPWSKAHPRARTQPVPEGNGPMFMTGDGICLGLDNGEVYNLTQERTVFPTAVRAAALYREDQGANAYVAVADSAGGPSSTARIGDYVDAEIVRASQRGI